MTTTTRARPAPDDARRGPRPAAAGALAAVAALAAGYVLSLWFAGGCSNPGAKFACLMEGVVLAVAAPVVVPLTLWWLLRVGRTPRALLTSVVSCVVAAGLAFPSSVLVEALHLLASGGTAADPGTGAVPTGLAAGLAAGCGVAAGVRLVARRAGRLAWAATTVAVVVALGVAGGGQTVLLDRAHRADLASADVLLAPPPGWVVRSPYVADDGGLRLAVYPAGAQPYGTRSVSVDVRRTPPDDRCASSPCTTEADGVRLADTGYSTSALTTVAGRSVEVRSLETGPVARESVLEVVRGLRPVDVDGLVALED